jgi:GGDEF domain-containing protein
MSLYCSCQQPRNYSSGHNHCAPVGRAASRISASSGSSVLLAAVEAHSVVERNCRILAAEAIVHEAHTITLTISSSIAGLASDQETLDTLLARADQALYRAKQAGRNQVALAPAIAESR